MNYPGVNEVRGYNVLNQLTSLSAGSENLTYNYPVGTNNGKISSMYNAVSKETVTYTYDSLNRLATAAGSGWSQQYSYDPFGNLTNKTPGLSISVNQATNQIEGVSGVTYDMNGNQSVGTYDVENRLVSVEGEGVQLQYAYDAQNQRIWSWDYELDGLGNAEHYFVNLYAASGQKLGEYQMSPGASNGTQVMNVTLFSSDQYFGGRRLAVMDQLGSVGNYYPWGEDKGGTSPQDTWNFATYWRDSITGLDYAHNRYYSSQYARFMTPDPYQATPTSPTDPKNPQSWNRYSYVTGDPVNHTDRSGLCEDNFTDCPNEPSPVEGGGGDGGCPPEFMENPGGGCNAPGPPGPASPPMPALPPQPTPQCDIEVGYSPWAGNFPGSSFIPGKHTFFYAEDPSGWNVVDAGPANYPTLTWVGHGWRTHPVLTGFGNLISNVSPTGLYNENTNPASSVYWESLEPCSLVLQLEADARTLNNVVPYSLPQLGSHWYNSNSFTYTVVTELGLPVPSPPVLAPGWGNYIP